MLKTNYHTHSTFCDGKDTPEEMVRCAIEKGFDIIGFSGHGYVEGSTYAMTRENTEKYIKEVNRLKAVYKDKIKVLCGLEADIMSKFDRSRFDYLIGSVHDVERDGKLYPVDSSPAHFERAIEAFDGDVYALIENYYKRIKDVIKVTGADMIGHFDLVTKFNENGKYFSEEDERYLRPLREALEALIDEGVPFEINTGAMARGWKSAPYPALPVMERILERGGKFVLNSDCHDKNKLDYAFDCVESMPIYERLKQSIVYIK